MLIDLRTKYPEINGKQAEAILGVADITINKNMVPFDSRSPFQTSGIRIGTPAITTRGVTEEVMPVIAGMIDDVIAHAGDETYAGKVREKVNLLMKDYPLFAW